MRYIDKIKEKPQVQHTLKERIKSAPKELIRRGLDDGTERLRGQLRDVAQHGQRDDFGGDQLGDVEVSGVKRAEQLAERLLGKRKEGAKHTPDAGPDGYPDRHDPPGAARPRDDGTLPPKGRHHGKEAVDPLRAQSVGRRQPQPQSALQTPQKRNIKTKDAYLKMQTDPAPATPPNALQQEKASFMRERQGTLLRSGKPERHLPAREDSPSEAPPSGKRPQGMDIHKQPRQVSGQAGGSRVQPRPHEDVSSAAPLLGKRPQGTEARKQLRQVSGQKGGSRMQPRPHVETSRQAMGSTAKTAVKERGVPVKSAGHPIRKTAGIGKPGGKPPVRAFPARQARRAAEAGARLARTQKAAKAARVTARQAAQAANRALRAVIGAAKALAAAATAGGGVVIAVVVVVCLCGVILASPLGIFFAGSDETTGAISPAQAVAQINGELGEKISSMQAEGGYDTLEIQGQPPPWSDILAVFAAKTAGAADGTTVAILDAANVEALRTVFWDMTKLTSSSREVEHPASGDTPAWTEQILTVTITARTPDDMRVFYSFTEEQNKALDELLANSAMLAALAGDLTISDATAKKLLADLPADLDPERRAVVEAACRLVGKVNYFWGGKSLVIGWDSRWGQLTRVWADGSSTTGTYLPYGLDCSGFVDWVFYNVTDGEYVIGHGGGAHMQHTYCTPISWNEAQPGDLVFYPGDEHVGIVGGRDESGNLLIIHCAFSQNNVVITGLEGFASIGRPLYYGE